jgi:hypothetical protein
MSTLWALLLISLKANVVLSWDMSELTDLERSYSPSYYVKSGDEPNTTIGKWVDFQRECFDSALREYETKLDVSYGREFFTLYYVFFKA